MGRRAGADQQVRVLPGEDWEWLEMAGKPSRGLVVGAGGGTRGGGRMVGEGSVGNPRACIVALPLSMVPVGECASGGGGGSPSDRLAVYVYIIGGAVIYGAGQYYRDAA